MMTLVNLTPHDVIEMLVFFRFGSNGLNAFGNSDFLFRQFDGEIQVVYAILVLFAKEREIVEHTVQGVPGFGV